MYPSDFSGAEPSYSRVEESLFLGLPPLLGLLLILLLIAVAIAMFLLGRWQAGEGSNADRAPEDIHRAILIVSLAAMGASSNDLKSRAEALKTAIRDYLGPVLDLAKGVSGPLKALEDALKGEVKEAAKEAHGDKHDVGHGHGHKPASGCTCSTPQACTCMPASYTINQVYIGGTPAGPKGDCGCSGAHKPGCNHDKGAHGNGGPDKPHDPKPATRPMTGPEQIDALSKAVRAIHDHWSDGPARIRELRDARAALSRSPPGSASRRRGGRWHNPLQPDDRPLRRVWDRQ